MEISFRHMLAAAATLVVSICAQAGWAQERTASELDETNISSVAQRSRGPVRLDEIVVTAQKMRENLQDVPIAMSVLSADDLNNRQIFDPTQLQYTVPSLQQQSVNNQVGATNFFIRGVGTAIYGPAVESAVSTVIDGVALARPAMGVVQFFDLERVEVLRGPQGMLFGKNASAGLVHIVTARPRIGEFAVLTHLSYGSTNSESDGNEVIAQSALNLPVSGNSAARMSAFITQQDGFAENVFMDEDLGLTEYGVRLKYLWEPSDNVEIYVAGDYAYESGPGGSVLVRRADAPGGFVASQNAAAGIVASPENAEIASNAPTDNHFKVGGGQANVVYSFGDGYSLTNVVAYRAYRDRSELDTDTLPIEFFDVNDQGRDQWQVSNELRLTSPSGRSLEYQIGLYYLYIRDKGLLTQTANLQPFFPPPPQGFIGNFGGSGSSTVRNHNYAVFGQASLSLSKNVRMIFGGRVTHDDIDAVAVSDSNGYVIPAQPSGSLSGELEKTNFSYRVGAEWDITPDVLGYATYARGYKSPTFGGATGTEAIRAEIPSNVELGLKSALFDQRLVLNVALYHVNFKDFQAQAFDPQLLRFTTTNAGVVRTSGVELDFRAMLAEGLSLNGGFALNDAIYKSFAGVACYFGQPTGSSGADLCLPNGTTDVTGNQLAFAPRRTGFVAVQYQHSIGAGLEAFITGNYYYRSSVNYTAAHDPMTQIDGYGLLGGSVGIQTEDSRMRASVFVRNLLDERIPTLIVADVASPLYGDDVLGGNYWHQLGESSFRTVGVSLDVRF